MLAHYFHGRRSLSIDNSAVRVTILEEGGHIAEILDKRTGVNALWIPPWPTIEPSAYDARKHPEYGLDAESNLLAGIMGHNLCLDFFGGPSDEEARAGLKVHGEASVAKYDLHPQDGGLLMAADLPVAGLRFSRSIRFQSEGEGVIEITETIENLARSDRAVGWTQHVTLGPPFLEKGATQFRATATRSKVIEHDFTGGQGHLKTGAEFDWPYAPRWDGGAADLRVFTNAPVSGAYTAHLMDLARERAFWVAFSPARELAFGYCWRTADFPWLGIWEENYSRKNSPWNGKTLTRGMEFGVSPMPESRRKMIDRGSLFGVPAYRWIPALSKIEVRYWAVIASANQPPESIVYGENGRLCFG